MKGAANLIKQLHKRCDGKGYSSVYKGEKIELVARIITAGIFKTFQFSVDKNNKVFVKKK